MSYFRVLIRHFLSENRYHNDQTTTRHKRAALSVDYNLSVTWQKHGLRTAAQNEMDVFITVADRCHKNLQKRGVCIFVRKDPYFSKINVSRNCKEKNTAI
jgi:hypothetical protein